MPYRNTAIASTGESSTKIMLMVNNPIEIAIDRLAPKPAMSHGAYKALANAPVPIRIGPAIPDGSGVKHLVA